MTRSTLLLATLLLASLTPSAHAQQRPPVALTADGIFGTQALLGDGYAGIAVTARNMTTATLRGHVEVIVTQWQQPSRVLELPLDLPPSESRRAIATPFLSDSASIEVRYVVEGNALASVGLQPNNGPAARALVVLADPPRLRGALLDLNTSVTMPAYGYGGGGATASVVPLGIVAFDARTGDPIAPTTPLGWSSVSAVVASAPTLARLSDEQRDALVGWIHAGGRMLVFPRTDADLAMPLLHDSFPDAHRGDTRERIDGQPPIQALDCGTATRTTFGCVRRAGFGAIYVADFDGAAAPYVELPTTRAIVSGLVDQANGGTDPVQSTLALGRHADDTSTDTYGYYGSAQRLSFGRLRAALDPNEGYRPALALVGIVLFLYVLLVGPLNFWWIGRRKTPTLALLTTPVLALACAAVMFFVGYVGKGVIMRYRRLEVVEAVDGDTIGVARRYTGYYFTRPSSMQTTGPEDGAMFRLLGGGGGTIHQGDTQQTLREVSGSLWETVFTREEHEIDLGQGISFTIDDHRVAAVHNGTASALESAFMVDQSGTVYVIGDVAAGASADIPRDGALYLPPQGYYDVSAAEVGTLRTALGLTEAEDTYALGLVRLLGAISDAGPMRLPVLYAQTAPEAAPTSSPAFAIERDLRILRVVPTMPVPDLPLLTANIEEVLPPPEVAPLDDTLQRFFGAPGTHGGHP